MATNTPINYSGEKIDYHQIQLAASRIEALLKALDLADATEQLTEKTLEDLNAIIQTIIDWDLSDDSSEVKDQLLNIYNSMVKKFKEGSHGIGVDEDNNERDGYAWFKNDIIAGDVSLKDLKRLIVELGSLIGDLAELNERYESCENVVDCMNEINNYLLSYSGAITDIYLSKLPEVDAKIGDLDSIHEDYMPATDVISYANKIANALDYVDDALATKQDKELIWKKLDNFTLTEDVDTLEYTLPDNCYGVIAQVRVPKAVSYGGNGYLYIQQSGGWVGAVYSGALSSTSNEKEIRLVAYPQNGYYQSYGVIKNGSNNTTFTRFEPSTTQFMSTKANKTLVSVKSQSKMYTGSIITIWGLIKE